MILLRIIMLLFGFGLIFTILWSGLVYLHYFIHRHDE